MSVACVLIEGKLRGFVRVTVVGWWWVVVREKRRRERVEKAEEREEVRDAGGYNCNFEMVVELKRLTDELVVVEVRVRESYVGPGCGVWSDKIRPGLSELVYKPGPTG